MQYASKESSCSFIEIQFGAMLSRSNVHLFDRISSNERHAFHLESLVLPKHRNETEISIPSANPGFLLRFRPRSQVFKIGLA